MRLHKRILLTLLAAVMLLTGSGIRTVSAFDGSRYYSMSYIMLGTVSQQIAYVDRANGALDAVTPMYFGLQSDGNLALTNLSTTFISEMHRRGIKVIALLSNNWDRALGQSALANRTALASQIANAIAANNLDGVDIDLENLTSTDRNDLTDLVRLVRNAVPSDKIVAVAVAANPTGTTTGWNGSYDYTALATYANYLMMMTYDEHYLGGPQGAVASYPFVEKSIKYALSKIDKSKLVLGLAFYGRYWIEGESYGGYSITNGEAENIIRNYQSSVAWDDVAKVPVATVTIKDSDVKPVALFKTMDAGTYKIYYENEQSLRLKLGLIKQYGLKGAGSWSLGFEPANMWTYYKEELASPLSNPFTDIDGNWSYDNILYAYSHGWMSGIGSGLFAPAMQMTRAQAATLFVNALHLDDGSAWDSSMFSDVKDHWAEKYIAIAAANNIMVGSDGLFRPDDVLTREQAAVLIERILPRDPSYKRPPIEYNDQVSISGWAVESVMRVTAYKLMSGYPNYTFAPQNALTRAEMAALIRRTMDHMAK